MPRLAVIDGAHDVATISRPRIITALGKQTAGKTHFLRWYVERSTNLRTRPLKLIDADPHNSTLAHHFEDAAVTGSAATEDRRITLEGAMRAQLAAAKSGDTYDALWDIGGGDLLMPRLAREVRFSETVEMIGIELVVFYVLGPSVSDLTYFDQLEEAGFRPKNLGLIFNAKLISGERKANLAFEAMLDAPLVKALVGRGARPLFMPALAADCVEAIEQSGAKTFREALPLLDMWHQIRLQHWLDEAMETQLAKPLIDCGWLA